MDTNLAQKIAAIAAQQKADRWAARQQAAQHQQQTKEVSAVERYRSQRIAQLENALNGLPARRQAFQSRETEAAELAAVFSKQVDYLATAYCQRINSERHQGRAIRLEPSSDGAVCFFFGDEIKNKLHHLCLMVNQRTIGAPLPDAETFLAELKAEELKLREELAELLMK